MTHAESFLTCFGSSWIVIDIQEVTFSRKMEFRPMWHFHFSQSAGAEEQRLGLIQCMRRYWDKHQAMRVSKHFTVNDLDVSQEKPMQTITFKLTQPRLIRETLNTWGVTIHSISRCIDCKSWRCICMYFWIVNCLFQSIIDLKSYESNHEENVPYKENRGLFLLFHEEKLV